MSFKTIASFNNKDATKISLVLSLWILFYSIKHWHSPEKNFLLALIPFLFLIAWIWPKIYWPIETTLALFVKIIGQIITYLSMALLYYLFFTLIALFFKLQHRDILQLQWKSGKKSFWIEKEQKETDGNFFLRQF